VEKPSKVCKVTVSIELEVLSFIGLRVVPALYHSSFLLLPPTSFSFFRVLLGCEKFLFSLGDALNQSFRVAAVFL